MCIRDSVQTLVAASFDGSTQTCACQSSCDCMEDVDNSALLLLTDGSLELPDACGTPMPAPTYSSKETWTSESPTVSPTSSYELCLNSKQVEWSEATAAGETYVVATIPAGLGEVSIRVSGYAVDSVQVFETNSSVPAYTLANATDDACDPGSNGDITRLAPFLGEPATDGSIDRDESRGARDLSREER